VFLKRAMTVESKRLVRREGRRRAISRSLSARDQRLKRTCETIKHALKRRAIINGTLLVARRFLRAYVPRLELEKDRFATGASLSIKFLCKNKSSF
jgi:hypothetical protein